MVKKLLRPAITRWRYVNWMGRLTCHVSSAPYSPPPHLPGSSFPIEDATQVWPWADEIIYPPKKKSTKPWLILGAGLGPRPQVCFLLTQKPATFYNREGPVPTVHFPGTIFLLPF